MLATGHISGMSGSRPANLMDIKLDSHSNASQQQKHNANGFVVCKAPNLMEIHVHDTNARDLYSTSAPSKSEFLKNASNGGSQQQQHYKHTVAGGLSKDAYSRQYVNSNKNQKMHTPSSSNRMPNNDRKNSESNEESKCS